MYPGKAQKTVDGKMKPFTCETCGKCFAAKSSLKNHKEAIHLKSNTYKCETCGRCFYIKQWLKTHKESVHIKSKYRCETCAKKELKNPYKFFSWKAKAKAMQVM